MYVLANISLNRYAEGILQSNIIIHNHSIERHCKKYGSY